MGIATAICLGGYGAVFWMWVIALVGGASAFVESTLAQIYKKRYSDGSGSYGGPAYYIEAALHSRLLAVLFCVFEITHLRGGLQHAGLLQPAVHLQRVQLLQPPKPPLGHRRCAGCAGVLLPAGRAASG